VCVDRHEAPLSALFQYGRERQSRSNPAACRPDRGAGHRAAHRACRRWIYQSRLAFEDGKIYLLRVVVDEQEEPPAIITAYRTSKIEKYWSAE
jgi:hypothetical protein